MDFYRRLIIKILDKSLVGCDDKVLKKIGRDHNKEIVLKDIENNRIFNKYIEKASELLKANGVNSVPTYLNGGNEIQF